MTLYKLLGATLVTLSGIAGAYSLNRSAVLALRQTEALMRLLRYTRTQVECFALPAPSILARCERELLVACGYLSPTLPDGFEEMALGCEIWDGESVKLFRGFAEAFGGGYREEQCAGCDYYCSLLEERRAALLEQLPSKKKRNVTLCLSGALAAVIVLI